MLKRHPPAGELEAGEACGIHPTHLDRRATAEHETGKRDGRNRKTRQKKQKNETEETGDDPEAG